MFFSALLYHIKAYLNPTGSDTEKLGYWYSLRQFMGDSISPAEARLYRELKKQPDEEQS